MFMPDFVDDVGDTLQELSIDFGTIDAILKSLTQLQSDVPGDDVFTSPTAQWFGTLPAGQSMGFHTSHAHEYLGASLKEMMETLGLLDEGVRLFRKGTNRTDEFTEDQLRGINLVIEKAGKLNRDHKRGPGAVP